MAVGSDPLPLTVREIVERLPLLAFLACRGRAPFASRNASQSTSSPRSCCSRSAGPSGAPRVVEPALERPARDNQALPSLSRSIVRRLKIKTSSLERTLLAATVPKVTSVRLSTLKSTSAAGKRLALAAVGRDRVGRGQRQLRPRDLEDRLLALGVQLPRPCGRGRPGRGRAPAPHRAARLPRQTSRRRRTAAGRSPSRTQEWTRPALPRRRSLSSARSRWSAKTTRIPTASGSMPERFSVSRS